jgi:thioredoxin-related protein
MGGLMWSLLLVAVAFARLSDGTTHVVLKDQKIVTSVDAGFHINKEAPASLKIAGQDAELQPVKKEEKEMIFDLKSAKASSVTLNFYVCDDKKTVCEQHEEAFNVKAGKLVKADGKAAGEVATTAAAATTTKKSSKAEITKDAHGFIEDNAAAALKMAKAENKIVMLEFSAPWCPACVRLATEVFGQASFQEATKNLIKVGINVDKSSNSALSKKYNVKAIPTMVFVNAKGEELYRMLDFKPADAIAKEITDLQNKKLVNIAALTKKANAGDVEAQNSLAIMNYNTMKFEEAAKWFAKSEPHGLYFANSTVNMWQEKSSEDEKLTTKYQEVLKSMIKEFPQSYEALSWRASLLQSYKDTIPADVLPIAQDNLKQVDLFLSNPEMLKKALAENRNGDLTGFEKTDLLGTKVETYKTLKDDAKMKAAEADLGKEISKMSLSTQRPGEMLMAIYYMKVAEKFDLAQANLESLIKTYPDTDVYYVKMARFYVGQKEYAKALPFAEKASAMNSNLHLNNLKLLAEVQKNLNQKTEALETIKKALSSHEAKLSDNKKLVTGLEDLKKSLQ